MKKQILNDNVDLDQKKETEKEVEEKSFDNVQDIGQTVGEAEVWKEKYIRALADYQNLEKRTGEEHQQVRMFAGLIIVEKLLPVVDLLEKAEEHLKDQGLELALKELYSFFRTIGVEKIDVFGKSFDPYTMDCIEIGDGGEENKVFSVVSDGYRMHNKLIRPAKVKVGKKMEEKEDTSINSNMD